MLVYNVIVNRCGIHVFNHIMCSIYIVADGYMLIILHEMAVPERGRKVDSTVILGAVP